MLIDHYLLNNIQFNIVNKSSHTANIYIDKHKKYFVKEVIHFLNYHCLLREIHILKLLNSKNYLWTPKLIHYNDKLLVTEYIGDYVTHINIPLDYLSQINIILQNLKDCSIKHNDIKLKEILVKNGRLFLCDFGWASINNDMSCGINISNENKPSEQFDDSRIIKYLKAKYDEKISKISTAKRRNNSGSQSETPSLSINNNNSINVSGYQQFNINSSSINFISKSSKYNLVKNKLSLIKKNCKSLIDIGCNSGIVSYTAHFIGYSPIYALDHDKEYLNNLITINNKLNFNDIFVQEFSFGNILPKADVVVMCALIHWIYSCTALFGDFDKIFRYLKESVNKYLIIEWIDPSDRAIGSLNHISFNKDVHTQQYNKTNFEKSLTENIGKIISIDRINKTRHLYIVEI